MIVLDLIGRANQAGVRFTLNAGRLRVEADNEPEADLVAAIIEAKADIFLHLRAAEASFDRLAEHVKGRNEARRDERVVGTAGPVSPSTRPVTARSATILHFAQHLLPREFARRELQRRVHHADFDAVFDRMVEAGIFQSVGGQSFRLDAKYWRPGRR